MNQIANTDIDTDADSDTDALQEVTEEFQPTSRLQRWRMVLGSPADASCGGVTGRLQEMDQTLAALYEEDSKLSSRKGGRGNSSPSVSRWLGDIRKYFPSQVVQVMQRDAMERLNLRELLLQPEMLENVQPDVHLVADLISLGSVIPQNTKATARLVVRKVVDALMKKLKNPCAAPWQVRWTAASATAARATPRLTGTARFAPICATGSPITRPSFPRR